MKVRYTDWGMASRIGNTIYLNRNLKEHPELFKRILAHEEAHTSDFGWTDIILDLNGKYLKGVKKQYYKFFLQYPKALTQFIPVSFHDGKISIDSLLLLCYAVALIEIGIIGQILL